MMATQQVEKPSRLLYIGLKYDYGQPGRGFSYEYANFLDTLKRMKGMEVEFFPFDEVMRSVGRTQMNERLTTRVKEYRPDVCFFVLFTDEIERRTIEHISANSGSVTLNWFGDDHWRFEPFSRSFATAFHWVLTTDSHAVGKYHALGCRNVVKTQWGFNHNLYKRVTIGQEHDVTFVGQVHSKRRRIVDRMHGAGIDVKCWGRGWEAGRLSGEEMIRMYSRSRINLNFTESSVVFGWKPVAKVFVNRRADDSIVVNTPARMLDHLRVLLGDRRRQIKGRNFEIPGCGGFLLTSSADNLEDYFVPQKEIVVFHDVDDLIEKVRYYLGHPDEREAIREAGYQRALREHTYEQRFRRILETIGYSHEEIRQPS
jgi:spore maturation protein CgeB